VVVGFDAPYRTGLVVFPDGRAIARTPELKGGSISQLKAPSPLYPEIRIVGTVALHD